VRRTRISVVVAALCLIVPALARADSILPDPLLTPGAARTTDAFLVCTPGYSRRVRHVTTATRRAVFALYGLAYVPGRYELDHLIPLELGGSNDIANLWPEAYALSKNDRAMGARVKDRLEDELHRRVCTNEMSLRTAQSRIRRWWTNAYRTYVGPL
jgi:hypothetical protein